MEKILKELSIKKLRNLKAIAEEYINANPNLDLTEIENLLDLIKEERSYRRRVRKINRFYKNIA